MKIRLRLASAVSCVVVVFAPVSSLGQLRDHVAAPRVEAPYGRSGEFASGQPDVPERLLAAGQRIRITVATREPQPGGLEPGSRVVGTLDASVRPGEVVVRTDQGAPTAIPRDAIAQVEVSTGQPSKRRRALWGLTIGAAAGVLQGLLLCRDECDTASSRAINVTVAGGVAGGIGAVIGALSGREKWQALPSAAVP